MFSDILMAMVLKIVSYALFIDTAAVTLIIHTHSRF